MCSCHGLGKGVFKAVRAVPSAAKEDVAKAQAAACCGRAMQEGGNASNSSQPRLCLMDSCTLALNRFNSACWRNVTVKENISICPKKLMQHILRPLIPTPDITTLYKFLLHIEY
jgi:hypothetical protein